MGFQSNPISPDFDIKSITKYYENLKLLTRLLSFYAYIESFHQVNALIFSLPKMVKLKLL